MQAHSACVEDEDAASGVNGCSQRGEGQWSVSPLHASAQDRCVVAEIGSDILHHGIKHPTAGRQNGGAVASMSFEDSDEGRCFESPTSGVLRLDNAIREKIHRGARRDLDVMDIGFAPTKAKRQGWGQLTDFQQRRCGPLREA